MVQQRLGSRYYRGITQMTLFSNLLLAFSFLQSTFRKGSVIVSPCLKRFRMKEEAVGRLALVGFLVSGVWMRCIWRRPLLLGNKVNRNNYLLARTKQT